MDRLGSHPGTAYLGRGGGSGWPGRSITGGAIGVTLIGNTRGGGSPPLPSLPGFLGGLGVKMRLRRYARLRPRRRRRRSRPRRYARDPLPDLDLDIEYVDEVVVNRLEKALRRRHGIRFLLGAFGDASLILKPRKGGKTVSVHHLVVGRRGEIKHYGIKGLKGWHGREEGDIQFYTSEGFNVEYDAVRDEFRVKRAKRK